MISVRIPSPYKKEQKRQGRNNQSKNKKEQNRAKKNEIVQVSKEIKTIRINYLVNSVDSM
jgi:hypothetical protein